MALYEEVIVPFQEIELTTFVVCHYEEIGGRRVLRFMPKIGPEFEYDNAGRLQIADSYIKGGLYPLCANLSLLNLSSIEMSGLISMLSTDHVPTLSDALTSIQSQVMTLSVGDISALSNTISSLTRSLSNQVSSLGRSLSGSLSSATRALSGEISAVSADMKNTKSVFDQWYNQARIINGMSTLNYYTYIGDDINTIKRDSRLSAISSDVLWFDTRMDVKDTPRNIQRLDNLQYQVYKLGLQVNDLQKIQTYGAIPGDVTNNVKDHLVQIAEDLEIPEDFKKSEALENIDVYGKLNLTKDVKYYTIFTPAGFEYDKLGKTIKWSLEDHDAGNLLVKTMLSNDGTVYYGLKIQLKPYHSTSYTSSIVYITDMSACIQSTLPSAADYKTDTETINNVIDFLSVAYADNFDVGISISTDVRDSVLGDYIQMDDPHYFNIGRYYPEDDNYKLSIIGEDYANNYTYYCAKFNDSLSNLPLVTDVMWRFVQSDGSLSNTQVFSVYDEDGIERSDASVLVRFINPNDMVCFPEFTFHNCQLTDLVDQKLSLFVQSNYDNTLSVIRELSVGGETPSKNEATVKTVCAKLDTYDNFTNKTDSLQTGELLFCTDKQKLAVRNSDGDIELVGSSGSSGGSGVNADQIKDVQLDYLTFKTDDLNNAKLVINEDGIKVNHYRISPDPISKDSSYNVYMSHLLQIGKIYCGGTNSGYSDCIASHNFIELYNASTNDINLSGLYLLYNAKKAWESTRADDMPKFYNSESRMQKYEFLKLNGTIKAKGTFLIRGAKCNDGKDVFLDIKNPDMEWRKKLTTDGDGLSSVYSKDSEYTRSGHLITFDEDQSNFYLVANTNDKTFTDTLKSDTGTIWTSNAAGVVGYIDLASVGKSPNITFSEGGKAEKVLNTAGLLSDDLDKVLYQKYFYMETAKQGNSVLSARNSQKLWTYIDFNKYKRNQGNYTQYYYSDTVKSSNTPHASDQNGNFFSGRTVFRKDTPNMVNITFGIQATSDNVNGIKASRCFNWISEGDYDEYVMFRKVGDESYQQAYSITEDSPISCFYNQIIPTGSASDTIKANLQKFRDNFYKRIHWSSCNGQHVTTHKVILNNKFDVGTYEYYIGRDNDPSYRSETMQFTVNDNSEVSEFSFVQVTDQQGFNWIEYQVWKNACDQINKGEPDFKFTINTGDIAQSGNRINEWLDYYDGRKSLRNKEEMFTIGNNDLCGTKVSFMGDGEDFTSKYNMVNVTYYYTFELDPRNSNYFVTINGYSGDKAILNREYPIYSLYSYNYGVWHFISLVSEIGKFYFGVFAGTPGSKDASDSAFAGKFNAKIEDWFKQDLILNQDVMDESSLFEKCGNTIIYMHEMPFTILPRSSFIDNNDTTNYTQKVFITRSSGSKLNDFNSYGKFRFSRLFRKYGIRLVMGGHKHTYSISKPVYDAPQTSIASYLSSGTNFLTSDEFVQNDSIFMAAMTESGDHPDSSMPVIEVLRSQLTSDNYYTGDYDLSSRSRFVVVDKIKAPTYVMSQATGYKLVSNKETPCPYLSGYGSDTPFLLSYFPGTYDKDKHDASKNLTLENEAQHRPMYIRYDLKKISDSLATISITAKQVDNILSNDASDSRAKASSESKKNKPNTFYDINNQYHNADLSSVSMTFGAGTPGYADYSSVYSDPNSNKYEEMHGWYQPRVSNLSSSYGESMVGNTYVLSCDL